MIGTATWLFFYKHSLLNHTYNISNILSYRIPTLIDWIQTTKPCILHFCFENYIYYINTWTLCYKYIIGLFDSKVKTHSMFRRRGQYTLNGILVLMLTYMKVESWTWLSTRSPRGCWLRSPSVSEPWLTSAGMAAYQPHG